MHIKNCFLPECIFPNAFLLVMTSKRVPLLLFCLIIEQSVTQNIRSVRMLIVNGSQFQCKNTTCPPAATFTVINILQCQTACLNQNHCTGAIFYLSSFNCELFDGALSSNGNMLVSTGVTSMVVINGTRYLSGKSKERHTLDRNWGKCCFYQIIVIIISFRMLCSSQWKHFSRITTDLLKNVWLDWDFFLIERTTTSLLNTATTMLTTIMSTISSTTSTTSTTTSTSASFTG